MPDVRGIAPHYSDSTHEQCEYEVGSVHATSKKTKFCTIRIQSKKVKRRGMSTQYGVLGTQYRNQRLFQ
jgi:hypothetical protein